MLDLRPFQLEGARFLAARPRALLADQMGVGKTPQVIRALGATPRDALVVCPGIAVTHWQREAARWQRAPHFLHAVSYDYVREHAAELRDHPWDVLVADEMHFTKNPEALRTQAVWGKKGVAPAARNLWAVSGTPAPNHYGELWPVLRAFGVWGGTYNEFKYRYCSVDDDGKVIGKTKDPARVRELRALLDPIMLRRLKKDVLPELPPLDVQPYYVGADTRYLGLTKGQVVDGGSADAVKAKLQERQLKDALDKLRTDAEKLDYLRGHVADFMTLRRVTGLLKVPAVADTILFEMENKLASKYVVYAYFVETINLLRDVLEQAGVRVTTIHGGTPMKKRDHRQNKFKKWTHGVMIGQILAAGTAIDLTSAHQGFLLERDWVPGNNAQALERMHRYGQTRPVTVRDVVIADSLVDESIHAVNLRKMRELSELFD